LADIILRQQLAGPFSKKISDCPQIVNRWTRLAFLFNQPMTPLLRPPLLARNERSCRSAGHLHGNFRRLEQQSKALTPRVAKADIHPLTMEQVTKLLEAAKSDRLESLYS
jgi:hypothetical protein